MRSLRIAIDQVYRSHGIVGDLWISNGTTTRFFLLFHLWVWEGYALRTLYTGSCTIRSARSREVLGGIHI